MSRRTAHAWGRHVTPHYISRLRTILEAHRGAARLVRARDLAVVLGITDPTGRSVRVLVNSLIAAGTPVGSVNLESGGGGYFIIETRDELERCLHNYRSRAREILRKAELLQEAYERGPRQPVLLATPAPAPDRSSN